ncbi:MAG TPA: hypothetical protein VGX93_01250 [Chthoniobacterales bacterium]|jgi:hypothetical protein|nr:hypothetical protein [Chthoniobacterales bacterium]
MRCLVLGAFLAMLAGVIIIRAENPLPIESANVLPEAISDDFEFRKFEIFRNAPIVPGATPIPTKDLMVDFERKHRLWGALLAADVSAKTGQYFTFFWRAKRSANITIRLEYRQANLKNYVQARELYYANAKGNHNSEFAIVGNDYENDGPITSWRAILIENRKIVALLQSRTWL